VAARAGRRGLLSVSGALPALAEVESTASPWGRVVRGAAWLVECPVCGRPARCVRPWWARELGVRCGACGFAQPVRPHGARLVVLVGASVLVGVLVGLALASRGLP